MLTYQEALQTVLEHTSPLPAENVSLTDALGRVLAHPAQAEWNAPAADLSAMDGFALSCNDFPEETFQVIGFVGAGHLFHGEVGPDQAVKIMTGAPLPRGCDTVVPIEEALQEGETLRVKTSLVCGAHVRKRGEEFQAGEEILTPGTRIGPGELSLLSAAGCPSVHVHPSPQVAVISTGDELVPRGTHPGPGQIVDTNATYLSARLKEEGFAVLNLGIAADDRKDLTEKIELGLQADILVTSGGVSVGDRDFIQEVLAARGFRKIFWRAAIKPGKPVLFGKVGRKPFFGLPGNPGAVAATCELFLLPALRKMAGEFAPLSPHLCATLTRDVEGGCNRERFLWGALQEEKGNYSFTPALRQVSGQNRCLPQVHALLPVPPGAAGVSAGSEVKVILIRLPRRGETVSADVQMLKGA